MSLLAAGCNGQKARSSSVDYVSGIAIDAQKEVVRRELGLQWPLEVGKGTLACESGAVFFRSGGIDYAVNDSAKARGVRPIDPIWEFRSEGWPSNPLKRITQDTRRRIFSELLACERTASSDVLRCKEHVRRSAGLSESELQQVQAEGIERRWPPLSANRKNIEPLIKIGLRLCHK